MKAWMATMIWGALRIVSKRLFNYITDPNRMQRLRFKHREAWYGWQQAAVAKKSEWRMRLAMSYGILWKFHTPPEEAKKRGDKKPYRAH